MAEGTVTFPLFAEFFKEYPNSNAELKTIAKACHDFGMETCKEQTAAMGIGVNDHAIARQRQYVQYVSEMLDAVFARPVPDKPYTHPSVLLIDLSERFPQFVDDSDTVVNESTQLLATMWMELAVSCSMSQSNKLAGSMIEYDYNRAKEQVVVISKYVEELAKRPIPDIPEVSKFPTISTEPKS